MKKKKVKSLRMGTFMNSAYRSNFCGIYFPGRETIIPEIEDTINIPNLSF
jgi:hypothetical protein